MPGTPSTDVPGKPIHRIRLAHTTHQGKDYRNRRFDDLNGNKAKFISCDFSYSIFHRAYFHEARFENCKFTGCQFYDSSLRNASLYCCDLHYATFYRTFVEPNELLASLPLEPNLRRDSLQNLRANAVDIGDFESQRTYVLAEIEAKADHLSRALRGSDGYYQTKYPTLVDRGKAGLTLLTLRFDGFVWGHGERPGRILLSLTIFLVLISLVNFWAVLPRVSWGGTREGLEVLRYSVDKFLDAPTQAEFRGFLIVDYILIIMRYLYIGLFISVLYKSISHR